MLQLFLHDYRLHETFLDVVDLLATALRERIVPLLIPISQVRSYRKPMVAIIDQPILQLFLKQLSVATQHSLALPEVVADAVDEILHSLLEYLLIFLQGLGDRLLMRLMNLFLLPQVMPVDELFPPRVFLK